MKDKYFGDIGSNASNWFSNPLRIVALVVFIIGMLLIILTPKINELINKKKEGNFILPIRIAGWVTAIIATFLAII